MRERCIHAVNPTPAPLPHGERLLSRRALFPFPRFQSSTLVEELSSLSLLLPHYAVSSPLSPSFPPSLSLPSVIAPAWLQGRIKAERRRREMGARKLGMEGGVALFSRGEREDRAALTHLQTPTEIGSTKETRGWQLHTLTDDEPVGAADVTNERRSNVWERWFYQQKSVSLRIHRACAHAGKLPHTGVEGRGAVYARELYHQQLSRKKLDSVQLTARHFRLPLAWALAFVRTRAQFEALATRWQHCPCWWRHQPRSGSDGRKQEEKRKKKSFCRFKS